MILETRRKGTWGLWFDVEFFHIILVLSGYYFWPQLCLVLPESRASDPGRVREGLSHAVSTEEGSVCYLYQHSSCWKHSYLKLYLLHPAFRDTWSLPFPQSICEDSGPAKWIGLLLGFSHFQLIFQLSLVC